MVSDTIMLQPLTLNMTLFLSDTPVTWRLRLGAMPGRAESVLERLQQLYAKRQLITVVTTNKTYKNMGITSIQISRSKDVGYAYQIPIAFKEVRVTKTKTADIPDDYGKSGKTGVSAGAAQVVESGHTSAAYDFGYYWFDDGL